MSSQQKRNPQVSPIRLAFVAFAATALTSLAAAASTDTLFQISDAITSGTGQNVFASDASKGFTGTNSTQLVYNNNSGSSYIVIKFGETSLTNVGDKITLDWTVAVTNGATSGGNAFRVGIFDVGTATSSDFETATGYRANYGSNVSTNGGRGFYERPASSNAVLFAGGSQFSFSEYSYTHGNFALTLNQTGTVSFTGTFSIMLLEGDKVQISTQIGSNAVATITDSAGVFTSFNSVAIWTSAGSSGGNVLTFSDLTVTSTSTIPESATVAAWLSGILAFACVMIRRRRRD
ncbi:hypothetical protein Ga0100230_021315 [Opitutaceae bacterium TAV3]|nr:hypothetical protein Ga0100230_021315 [Opitutaceae bacterium TAV3]